MILLLILNLIKSFFKGRLQACQSDLMRSKMREQKLSEDNRQLGERTSVLEKECASLLLELKTAQTRYQQEVRAHEETEKSRLVNNEQANLEIVKGMCFLFIKNIISIKLVLCFISLVYTNITYYNTVLYIGGIICTKSFKIV